MARCVAGAVGVLVVGCAACHGDHPGEMAAGLTEVSASRSIVLLEDDSLALGRPYDFDVVDSGGSVVVSDAFAQRGVGFGPDGMPWTRFGGPGDGPGEFRAAGTVLDVGEGEVAVFDMQRKIWQLFAVTDGSYRGALRTFGFVYDAARVGDTVWMGSMSVGSHNTLERWVVGDSTTTQAGGAYPTDFDASPAYVGFDHAVYVAPLGEGLLQGFGGRNELYVLNSRGEVADTIRPAVAARRGVPEDVVSVFETNDLKTKAESLSLLKGVHVTAQGQIALVHEDLQWDGRPPAVRVHSTSYLSLVDRQGQGPCVDLRLPLPVADERPLFEFEGDTLLALQRHLEGEKITTVIHVFPLPVTECR